MIEYKNNLPIKFEPRTVHSCDELIDAINRLGFLPLLRSNIDGYCAEALMDDDCRFVTFDDGSWEWPLWQWKGPAVTEGHCVYGKFFNGKAGFVALEWWPDFFNWRRGKAAAIEPDSIEDAIIATLSMSGSMISRDLRKACGFTGPRMRSRFDAFITRLQMDCRIVTQDFVYPRDKHGKAYGWGLSLLTTPEQLPGKAACRCERTPEQSWERMANHLSHVLLHATPSQIKKLLG